jgi:hypothetical protein
MSVEMVDNGGDNKDDRKRLQNDNSTAKKSLRDYLLHRWERSKLRKFYELNDVDSKDIDDAINTVAVLNGLILTIPFGLMSLLGQQFWDWFQSTLETCSRNIPWIGYYDLVVNALYATVYSSLIILTLATLYYLLKPDLLTPEDQKIFKEEWWPRAKWFSVIILICTVISIVSLLCLFNLLMEIYVQSTNHLCTQFDSGAPNRYAVSEYIGVALYLLSFLYAVFIMI